MSLEVGLFSSPVQVPRGGAQHRPQSNRICQMSSDPSLPSGTDGRGWYIKPFASLRALSQGEGKKGLCLPTHVSSAPSLSMWQVLPGHQSRMGWRYP